MPGPLHGLRVLDLSRVLAGPWAMQNLGDMGADVIKVERPGQGDDSRHWGPPWFEPSEDAGIRESAYFLSANRNKRSVAIDIAEPAGAALVRELVAHCDIFIENFKVGSLARYGLDYESIRACKPDIIYLSLTAYGQDGPYADRPGYDYLFQGVGGLMSVTGERDDRPGGGPQRCGIALIDLFTGMYSTVAILAALHHRTQTGEGQHIDMALFDTIMAVSAGPLSNYMLSGKVPGRIGNASPSIAPYGVFPTADGELIVASANQSQWVSMCKAIGRPELASDPRFAKNGDRIANYELMYAELSAVLRTKTRAQWEAILDEAGVPAGPINDYAQALSHPQAAHRGLRVEIDHPAGSPVPSIASPLRFSKTPVQYRRPPPLLGEHTFEVLRECLGMSEDRLGELASSGLIADRGWGADRNQGH
jgi:crotonobetainyl-CoA:carnitine CoA-transferase CaiB-like acyl-CoA transferase